jgi:hypothetical protein
MVRLAYNSDDAEELVSSCRAIQDALDTFYVSCSRSVKLCFIDPSPGWAHSVGGKEHARYSEGVSLVIEGDIVLMALIAYGFPVPPSLS